MPFHATTTTIFSLDYMSPNWPNYLPFATEPSTTYLKFIPPQSNLYKI